MYNLLTQFGETNSSGVGALGVSGQAFVIQLTTFAIAFLVLRRYAFKPILKVLNERRETIEKGVKLGEEMQKEKAALEEKVTASLHKARTEADGIIASAHAEAQETIRNAEEKAREKAEGIVADAQVRINHETARARKKLEGELVGLISEATEAVVGEKIDAKKDAALIDKVLKERVRA